MPVRLKFLLLALTGLLAGCTDPAAFYRSIAPEDPSCATIYRLGEDNREWRVSGAEEAQPLRCFLQVHELPASPDQDGNHFVPWQAEAARFGRELRDADRYHLAFVEMSDDNRLHLPAQMARLTGHLDARRKAGQRNYVISYVHGWRHDAEILDRDLENFRVVLAYARAAMNTRCAARGEYCNTALTGVFVAWRGRQFREPPALQGRNVDPFIVGAAPTFWNRLDQSTTLGRENAVLSQVLDGIQARLTLDPRRKDVDKYLIFGHSMGGNMLATLMQQRYLAQLARHPAPAVGGTGTELKPVLGDLVVLLNPAAKARKWTSLQRAERALAGLADEHYLTSNDGGQGAWEKRKSDRLRVWRGLYPFSQRPVYISLTSTGNWWLGEGRDRVVESDTATGDFFPIGQELAGLKGAENRLTIGHLLPRYRESRLELVDGAEPVGVSHEFIVRQGALVDTGDGRRTNRKASYVNATDPAVSWCDPANGWLLAAREEARDTNGSKAVGGSRARFDQFWVYGEGTENIAPGRNGASVLWRHQINLSDGKRGLPVVPGTSPFWNVRAFDTAIRGHKNWVSYPMWCALNQLVLDDVTATRRVDGNVEIILEAQPEQDIGAAAN